MITTPRVSISAHFRDKKTEGHRGLGICPRSPVDVVLSDQVPGSHSPPVRLPTSGVNYSWHWNCVRLSWTASAFHIAASIGLSP